VHRLLVQQQQGRGADVPALRPAVSTAGAGTTSATTGSAAEGAGSLEGAALGTAERSAEGSVAVAPAAGELREGVAAPPVLAGVVLTGLRPGVVVQVVVRVALWLVVAGHESS
jgi:hypothetical protein